MRARDADAAAGAMESHIRWSAERPLPGDPLPVTPDVEWDRVVHGPRTLEVVLVVG
ncbi:hypothetical protein [Goekera deserti]|uniref:Uncharacterized protein n=1 Tax=Goekera deserti TaxID=2497753 RepID=A0A7K3WD12_9ACTN|nr:hypothetical protein [Goekera deserti]NDI46647.1 hypothetical protein [Goekera deserti]NEL54216.1 hypothetical protein [Goekera deserti]